MNTNNIPDGATHYWDWLGHRNYYRKHPRYGYWEAYRHIMLSQWTKSIWQNLKFKPIKKKKILEIY